MSGFHLRPAAVALSLLRVRGWREGRYLQRHFATQAELISPNDHAVLSVFGENINNRLSLRLLKLKRSVQRSILCRRGTQLFSHGWADGKLTHRVINTKLTAHHSQRAARSFVKVRSRSTAEANFADPCPPRDSDRAGSNESFDYAQGTQDQGQLIW
jgi:hypothetical protein